MNIPQRDYRPLEELIKNLPDFRNCPIIVYNELLKDIFDKGYSQGFAHGWKIYEALKTDNNEPINEEPIHLRNETLKPVFDLGYSQGFEHGWKCYQAMETDGAGEEPEPCGSDIIQGKPAWREPQPMKRDKHLPGAGAGERL